MDEGPDGGGRQAAGWRAASVAIWAAVLGTAALGLLVMAFTWDDADLPSLGLPRIEAPELSLPDLGGLRVSPPEDPKPGSPRPEGMARADRVADARPVEADRSGS